jgi:nuclear pore complex protein Nup133
MFAFDSALKNSRRRLRASSDDSLKLPKAKRQRSVLRQDAFEPPSQVAFKPAQESQRALPSMQSDNDSGENLSHRQVTIRGPKIETTPSESVDGTVILVSLSERFFNGYCHGLTIFFRNSLGMIITSFPSFLPCPIKFVN